MKRIVLFENETDLVVYCASGVIEWTWISEEAIKRSEVVPAENSIRYFRALGKEEIAQCLEARTISRFGKKEPFPGT